MANTVSTLNQNLKWGDFGKADGSHLFPADVSWKAKIILLYLLRDFLQLAEVITLRMEKI